MREQQEHWLGTLKNRFSTFSTKTDLAHQILREAILAGLLPPGGQIAVRELAARIGMSQIPIREAFRRLEQEGLVLIKPHIGVFVRDLPWNEIEENLLIRGELEALAVRLVTPLVDADTMVVLEELCGVMDETAANDDSEQFGRQNREFHLTLYRVSPYGKLTRLIESLWDLVPRARSVFELQPGYMSLSQHGHRQLLAAVKTGDVEGAVVAIKQHRGSALQAIREAHLEAAQVATQVVEGEVMPREMCASRCLSPGREPQNLRRDRV